MIPHEELGPQFAAAVTCQATAVAPAAPSFGSTATRELATALDKRRSIRSYADEPVPQHVLSSVIESGRIVDHELWSGNRDLGIVVLAARVAGLEPGVYEYESTFTRLAPLPALTDHVFQPDIATAAAAIVVCGDLTSAVNRHGPHGYRRLLTRAGAIVAACHLAASRAGLHSCPFDGLLPEGANPVRDLSLFALALGSPKSDTEPIPSQRSSH